MKEKVPRSGRPCEQMFRVRCSGFHSRWATITSHPNLNLVNRHSHLLPTDRWCHHLLPGDGTPHHPRYSKIFWGKNFKYGSSRANSLGVDSGAVTNSIYLVAKAAPLMPILLALTFEAQTARYSQEIHFRRLSLQRYRGVEAEKSGVPTKCGFSVCHYPALLRTLLPV